MGLDMYLYAEEYVSKRDYFNSTHDKNGDFPENPKYNALIEAMDIKHINRGDIGSGITVHIPMGYWRKANAIHGWFVRELADGRDECQPIYVPRVSLEELKSLCERVLADNSLAEELLPPEQGFFFGTYDIDEWYLSDLQLTLEIIDECLASDYEYFEYQASW